MMKWLRGIFYSFPVQLLLLHFKKHQLIMVVWALLFAIVTNNFGQVFGVPYLFLEPEYLGSVSLLSYFIVGCSLGAFAMTFQATSYVLNSYRFPFLATLQRPFASYAINNSLIPLAFVITYVISMFRFQVTERVGAMEVASNLGAFAAGLILVSIVTAVYFLGTNKNVFNIIRSWKKKGKLEGKAARKQRLEWEKAQQTARVWPVESFFSRRLNIRLVRSVEHYDEKLLIAVFRQHHLNTFLIEILAIASMIVLGYLIDYRAFIIPAGSSILMLFSVIVALLGAFTYWTRGWRSTAFIATVVVINLLVTHDLFDYQNKAYGVDYTVSRTPYTSERIDALSSRDQVYADLAQTYELLENRKRHLAEMGRGTRQPIFFVAASGGGHRASLWSTLVVQYLDSLTDGAFFDHTALMTGASGGMLGLAYYRELKLRAATDTSVRPDDRKHLDYISKDFLNAISFTVAVNDIFFPRQRFLIDNNVHRKDRGYIMERHFNQNTNFVLDKALGDYHKPEFDGLIPMMVLAPTVVRDGRKLLISAQPVSYLCRPRSEATGDMTTADAIDFATYFASHQPEKLRWTTALRMNATYPYILPNVFLPSEPPIDVMDAGLRDNFGIETIVRFAQSFRSWLNANASEIIVIHINSVNQEALGRVRKDKGLFSRIFSPVGNLFRNVMDIQTYNQNNLLMMMKEWFPNKMRVIELSYRPSNKDQIASMSFHLTQSEKLDIIQAIQASQNQDGIRQVREVLNK